MRVFHFSRSKLLHPPEEIAEFVLRLVGHLNDYQGDERRSEARHRIALPLLAMPLNEQLKSAGEGFAAVTRDISTRGLALFHVRPVHSPFLAVELTDRDGYKLEAAVQVLRCRKVDSFHEIAGKFVTKVYDAPGEDGGEQESSPGSTAEAETQVLVT